MDPRLVDPDEDAVQTSFDHAAIGWVDEPPPRLSDGVDPQEAAIALGTWADTTKGFDEPDVTAHSLDAGLLAYRGRIPPDAIKVISVPSEGAAHFYAGATAVLGTEANVAAVPELGFYKTEVARAVALGRSLIRSAAESIDEPVELLLPEWPQTEYALNTEGRLQHAARVRRHLNDLVGSAILHEASHVAHAISELQPELGWRVARDAAIGVAQSGTDLIRELETQRGHEVALLGAQAALDSVVATPEFR